MAQRPPAPILLSVEEFEAYDVPDGMRAELVRGELRLIPPPGFRHGVVGLRLAARLASFVESHQLGFVTSDSGYELVGLDRTVRAPDIAFVAADRLPPGELPVGIAHLRPDLAVEVLSPSEARGRLNEKLDDFKAAGVPLVWIVDSERRTVTVIENAADVRVLHSGDTLGGEKVLPGFACSLDELFTGF